MARKVLSRGTFTNGSRLQAYLPNEILVDMRILAVQEAFLEIPFLFSSQDTFMNEEWWQMNSFLFQR